MKPICHRVWIVVAGLVAALAGGCASAPARKVEVRLPHVTSRFANGLELLVAPDTTTELVHVAVRYRIGSGADPVGKRGLAHLVEHLTFVARSGGETITSRLGRASLEFNAATHFDTTHYMATGRADQLLGLLAIEARRIRVSCEQISEETFARELAVVRNELRSRASAVTGPLDALLGRAYGKGHPYTHLSIGVDSELARLTREDACEFLRAHYAANQAIVVVIGRVDPDRVERIVSRFFARVRARGAVVPPLPAPRPNHQGVRASAPLKYRSFLAGWHLPPPSSADRIPAEIALAWIAALASVTDSDAVHVSSGLIGGATATLGVIAVEIEDPSVSLEDAERAVLDSAERVRTRSSPVLAALGRAVALTQAFFEIDSYESRGMAYADLIQQGARGHLLLDALGRAERVDDEKVRLAARQYFTRERVVKVLVVPDAAAAVGLGEIGYRGHEELASTVNVDAADAARPMEIRMPRERAAAVRRIVTEGGLEVVLVQSSSVPTFTARLVFRAGTADDPTGGGAAAGAVFGLRPDPDWAEGDQALQFLGNGGRGWRAVERDTCTFAVEGLAPWSDVLLSMLGALVVDGHYTPEGLTEVRERLAEPEPAAERALQAAIAEAVWGRASRNARVLGRSVALDGRATERFRRAYFTAGNATLVVTGRFDPDLVTRQIEEALSDLPRSGQRLSAPRGTSLRRSGPAIRRIVQPGAAALIDLIVAVPVPRETDRAAALILRHLMSRAADRVRMGMGAAYQSSSFHDDEPHGGTLGIRARVNVELAGQALRAVREDLAELVRGDESLAASFVVARRHALEAALTVGAGARATSDAMAAAAGHGRAVGDRARLAAEIARLTLADLRPVAAELLRPESQAIILRGPAAALDATLRRAGLAGGTAVRR